ncbi:MAG: chemotaxis protein CheX [Planctomycetes bacterium]|nr:chemotaxis protein CheX [Planctomycetota bacterium]
MTDTLAPHLIDDLRKTATEILETMVSMTPTSVEAVPEETSSFSAEVIGMLGFTGTRAGTFVVRSTEQLARMMAARMLMMEPEELGDFAEVSDAFGEIVNMLTGNFKNSWVALGNQMELSVPNVIHHGSVSVNSDSRELRACVRVQVEGHSVDIGVHFESKD